MTFEQLRCFTVLAVELHFTRAARRLRIAQPALSKHIRQLERSLGLPLFQRTRRSVQLTPEGDLLLDHARRTLASARELEGTAERLRLGTTGRLRIGFTTSALHHVLPAIMRRFRQTHPDVETSLSEAGTAEQLQRLAAGELDVAIVRPGGDRPPSLTFLRLLDEPFVAVLPRDHRLAARRTIRLKELATDPFVLVARRLVPGVFDQVMGACRAAGFAPETVLETSHYHAVAGMVGAGCGVSILAASIEHVQLPDVVYKPLADVRLTSPIVLAYPAHHRSAVIDAFVETTGAVFPVRETDVMPCDLLRRRPVAAALILLLTAAGLAGADVVADTRAAIARNDLAGAERLATRAVTGTPRSPEALLALSWVGRGALAARQWDTAMRVARDTERRVLELLKTRALDAEPSLPLALGAAYEVQAQALAAQEARSEALLVLTGALRRFGSTSIQARLQKNVHLIGLAGQPMPRLDTAEYLTATRLAPGTGRPTLLFFWAHWCSDCKAFAKALTAVQAEFADRGLRVIAPTRRYGYIGSREDVPPGEERRHIQQVQREFYPTLASTPIPLSAANFATYGVSTTPTLVLVDATGRVRRYHPGAMTGPELRAAVADLFRP